MADKNKPHWKSKFLASAFFVLIFIGFAWATHIVSVGAGGLTNIYTLQNKSTLYNITIYNNDTGGVAGSIFQVNITLPGGFVLLSGSAGANHSANATSVQNHTFANNSAANQVISFSNFSADSVNALISTGHNGTFWFSANATTPGNYTIVVTTVTNATLNATGPEGGFTFNISVQVNDTTAPTSIGYGVNADADGANVSRNSIIMNITGVDNGNFTTTVYVYNMTNQTNILNTTNNDGSLPSYYVNLSAFGDGQYNINASIVDLGANTNSSIDNRTITVDRTAPTASATCSPASVQEGGAFPCTCGGTDATSGVKTTSGSSNSPDGTGTPQSTGSFTYTCDVTDYAGNSAQDAKGYTVTSAPSGNPGGGGGPSNNNNNNQNQDTDDDEPTTNVVWSQTINENDVEFSEKGSVTRTLKSSERVLLFIGGATHHVGVKSISGESATLEISSTPQEVTLDVGVSEKFDVSEDGYYDVRVTLVSVTGENAEVMMESIRERVVVADDGAGDGSSTTDGSGSAWWIVLVVLVLAGVGAWFWIKKKNG